jgi:hypothetical protein
MKTVVRNERGQMMVEAILFLTLFFVAATITADYFKDEKLIQKVVAGPWQHIAGMMENGVWEPPNDSKTKHPNLINRHGSPIGESL